MALGLTGGIATGKSTAAGYLREFGAEIIDADNISRQVMRQDGPAYEDVVAHFGGEILREDGSIDRKRLGELVFNDSKQRQKLEKLTHPYIIERLKNRLAQKKYAPRVVAVVPLLYEADLEELFREVWVISCSQETQLERLQERNNISRADACQRLSAQLDIKEKEKRADLVIKNDGSREELRKRIKKAWQDWLERRR